MQHVNLFQYNQHASDNAVRSRLTPRVTVITPLYAKIRALAYNVLRRRNTLRYCNTGLNQGQDFELLQRDESCTSRRGAFLVGSRPYGASLPLQLRFFVKL